MQSSEGDMVMAAWGLIANAHPQPWAQLKADPDTPQETKDWIDAAEKWRDEQFHPWLDGPGRPENRVEAVGG
jgi:hypothetical protein